MIRQTKKSLWLTIVCLSLGLLLFVACSDESDPLANDPLAPTVAAGEAQPPGDEGAVEDGGGGGLGDSSLENPDVPSENSAVTGVNPLVEGEGEEAETGTGETAAGQTSGSSGSAVLPSVSFNVDNVEGQDEALREWTAAPTVRYIDAVNPTADTPDAERLPGYVDVHLSGSESTGQVAHVYVFPVGVFEESNETAAGEIEGLRQLLAEQPESATEALPFLPLSADGQQQALRSQIAYLNFEGGSGVRYLTQYINEGEATPINNDQLLYTFQGLTEDGEYYVAAVFPLEQADLPAAAVSASGDLTSDYEGYLEQTGSQLNEADPDSFTPNLTMLDALIQSIIIEGPTGELDDAYPANPENGDE